MMILHIFILSTSVNLSKTLQTMGNKTKILILPSVFFSTNTRYLQSNKKITFYKLHTFNSVAAFMLKLSPFFLCFAEGGSTITHTGSL